MPCESTAASTHNPIQITRRLILSFLLQSNNIAVAGKRYKLKNADVLFSMPTPRVKPKMRATSSRMRLTKSIAIYKFQTENAATKESYRAIRSYISVNGDIRYKKLEITPIRLLLNISLPNKYIPIIPINPEATDTNLPANNGSRNMRRAAITNQANRGCFPSVRDINRHPASFVPICDQRI